MVERRFTALFPVRSTARFSHKQRRVPANTAVGPQSTLVGETASAPNAGEVRAVVPSERTEPAAPPLVAEDAAPPPPRSKFRVRALAERPRHPISPPIAQEVDSGFRLPRDAVVAETLPPPYTPD